MHDRRLQIIGNYRNSINFPSQLDFVFTFAVSRSFFPVPVERVFCLASKNEFNYGYDSLLLYHEFIRKIQNRQCTLETKDGFKLGTE